MSDDTTIIPGEEVLPNSRESWNVTMPVDLFGDYQIIWTGKTNQVCLSVCGIHIPCGSWKEFKRKLDFLIPAVEKHQH